MSAGDLEAAAHVARIVSSRAQHGECVTGERELDIVEAEIPFTRGRDIDANSGYYFLKE